MTVTRKLREDTLAVVQFIHPGKEQTSVQRGWCQWNSAVRSDKAWPHRRKFLLSQAAYLRRSVTSKSETGKIGFWGEWESPSYALEVRKQGIDFPQFYHLPALYEPVSYEGLLDTDPFVFGKRFLYNGCQQHTAHNRPGGAVETFLRRLAVGSMILFGSSVRGRFVLDTVLVVSDYKDYPNGVFTELQGLVPKEYYAIALHPQARGNKTVDSFRLYRGAMLESPVAGMFSFVPCSPAQGIRFGFVRPNIVLPILTQNLTQGKKLIPMHGHNAVLAVWTEVVQQVLATQCALAHYIEFSPLVNCASSQREQE